LVSTILWRLPLHNGSGKMRTGALTSTRGSFME